MTKRSVAVDRQGLSESTIVLALTDNGPMVCRIADAGTTPFRGEKNMGGWEGSWRVPALIRWAGTAKLGTVLLAGTSPGQRQAFFDFRGEGDLLAVHSPDSRTTSSSRQRRASRSGPGRSPHSGPPSSSTSPSTRSSGATRG